jgi:hypothetical protein
MGIALNIAAGLFGVVAMGLSVAMLFAAVSVVLPFSLGRR